MMRLGRMNVKWSHLGPREPPLGPSEPPMGPGDPHLTHVAVYVAPRAVLFDPLINSIVPHKTHVSNHLTYINPLLDQMTPHGTLH